ncbi:MAG: cysteine synthase A [Deltaproteobacteria bacterium]|nr:cysteine synthase A [Candidatus Anaeroferrophillacea bacterium]
MTTIASSLADLVGYTPLLRLNDLSAETGAEIVGKLETANPLSSIKDRTARAMIDAAERDGRLAPGGLIIEPTSGNTGIGLAWIAAARGYRLILTMPETMSEERRRLVRVLGAELVLTPGAAGMQGAVDRARELHGAHPESFMPQQFANPANPEVHRRTTGPEIWTGTGGRIDALVAGVGTGGTITGCGEVLKSHNPDLQVIAVEPAASPVLSGGTPGPHRIQGIGAGFIPEVLNREIIDEIITVTDEDAAAMCRRLARTEGLPAGISSGATLTAARQYALRPENRSKQIVAIIWDTGERYLSTWIYAGE